MLEPVSLGVSVCGTLWYFWDERVERTAGAKINPDTVQQYRTVQSYLVAGYNKNLFYS